MTRDEFRGILAPFVLAMRQELDAPTWTAYFRVLDDLPVALLEAGVQLAQREDRKFFPSAPELRALAERARQQILAAHPYQGCIDCEPSKGFRAITDGSKDVERCPCFARHQAHVAALGVGTAPVALPAAERDWTQAGDPS